MRLLLSIASRYLFSRKAHSAVNIISIISLCGVVVATAAIVCVLSVFNGFRGVIMDRLATLDPPLAITATTGKAIADADSVVRAVTAVEGVQRCIPVIEDQALAVFADYQMPVRIKGVTDDYTALHSTDSIMLDGSFTLHDEVARYAVLSVGTALQLHARPGYAMMGLYAPRRQGRVNLSNPMGAFTHDSLFVSGVFEVRHASYDQDLIYVPIEVARQLLDYPTQATQLEVQPATGTRTASLRRAIAAALGPAYQVKDQIMQQAESFRMVNIEKWITFLLLAFILLIATFNVISTLSLLIIEKDQGIDTLRALGATDSQITHIFIAQGWLITLTGAVIGIVLGLALCLGQQMFGWLTIPGDSAQMLVEAYPVRVIFTDLLAVIALVAIVALLTSLATMLIMRRRLARQRTTA